MLLGAAHASLPVPSAHSAELDSPPGLRDFAVLAQSTVFNFFQLPTDATDGKVDDRQFVDPLSDPLLEPCGILHFRLFYKHISLRVRF